MRVLFDQATPVPLRRYLEGHIVWTADQQGWGRLRNLSTRRIAIVVLGKGNWPLIEPHVQQVVVVVSAATPGSFAEVDIPFA